jgi:hypothetical protein
MQLANYTNPQDVRCRAVEFNTFFSVPTRTMNKDLSSKLILKIVPLPSKINLEVVAQQKYIDASANDKIAMFL